jgi:hypothetical protein
MKPAESKRERTGVRTRLIGQLPRRQATYLIALLGGAIGGVVGTVQWRASHPDLKAAHAKPDIPSVAQMMSMSDSELDGLDPIVMDLAIARGIPECMELDVSKYVTTVDEWAIAIREKNSRDEAAGRTGPLYRQSKKLWLAGGMAIELARTFGVRYTAEPLNLSRPDQSFVYGAIERGTGTCASMPVLYLAIGRRLGWPIHAVVSNDHMWARWDDGIPVDKGGERFNLEATTAGIAGHENEFCSNLDSDYADELKTPAIAIRSGSDMSSLTSRETLGIFLQARAGYWSSHQDWRRAEDDAILALACFPRNRDLRIGLLTAMSHTNPSFFTSSELARLSALLDGDPERDSRGQLPRRSLPHYTIEQMERINRDNARQAAAISADVHP